jgi:hypothetical protein
MVAFQGLEGNPFPFSGPSFRNQLRKVWGNQEGAQTIENEQNAE